MRPKPLIWRLLAACLSALFLVLLLIAMLTSHTVRDFHQAQMRLQLETWGNLFADQACGSLSAGGIEAVQNALQRFHLEDGSQLMLMLPDGQVFTGAGIERERIENLASRAEVAEALKGHAHTVLRSKPGTKSATLYAAVPIQEDGRILGVVCASTSMEPLEQMLWRINLRILFGGALAVLFTIAASLLLARRINHAMETIKQGAERFARGDFSNRLVIPDAMETATLAEAINEMAAQLHERIRNEVQQRCEQEAVLSSMVEGVLAVDTEQNVISLNKAAAQLFKIDSLGAAGRGLQEVVRNPALHRFVAEALRNAHPVESEIVLSDPAEQILQAHGTVLRDAQGKDIGAVIVLNDVTRLRRLERIRRDFVANVSHELRTPITSIKGFVETLLDGALQDAGEAMHFLEIVGKQADRLNAIIEDLLTLSRVEQEAEKAEVVMRRGKIQAVLKAAIELCAPSAAAKEIAVEMQCPEELHAYISAPLLEQAVVNLLDNAIKYSEYKGIVEVSAQARGSDVAIEVRDHGCGIPPEHLPRLFERFYRVDKARSRQLGGTGLGLAIVKHIAQTHEGQVLVESKPGRGSLFTILLPSREGKEKAKPDGQEYS